MADLLIRGGAVVDGTGAARVDADVRIAGGRIAEVAPGLRPDGETVLDASGAVVAPGFIDNHTHFDPTLFWDPDCDPMPQHGVTSVVVGNCSLSLAPLRAAHREQLTRVFSYIEDIPFEAFERGVPWSWETYPEFRKELAERAFGVNVAPLVGHSPLRLFVMGEEAWERPATVEERQAIVELLEECLDAGALGCSFSFLDEDPDGRLVPSRIADPAERRGLVAALARRDAVAEFVPALFLDDPLVSMDEMVVAAGELRPTMTFNGIVHRVAAPHECLDMLDRCLELRRQGIRMYPQITPRTYDVRINWNTTMTFMQLPRTWHKLPRMHPDERRRALSDPAWRADVRAEWDGVALTSSLRQPQRIRLVEVSRPENERFLGQTLADAMAAGGLHGSDALAEWVLANDLAPGVVAIGVANSDAEMVARTLTHPAAILGNSDAGAHLGIMCATGDATLLLTRHVREREDLTLERAVHELTQRQAAIFGLPDRGVLEPGRPADVTVFALDELAWEREEIVRDLPGGGLRLRRPGGGYRATIVAGEVVQAGGELAGRRPGVILDRATALEVSDAD